MNVLNKLEKFKKQLKAFMPDMDETELKKCLNRIRHYSEKARNVTLTVREITLYRFIVMKGNKPNTMYAWLLLDECSAEIKERYEKEEISLKEAVRLGKKDYVDSDSANMIIEEINWSYECFFSDGGETNDTKIWG